MGMFAQLSDDDVTAVIEYVKSFSRLWRKAENYAEPLTLPARPGWFDDAKQRAAHALTGRTLFRNTCAACHGTNADGQGPTAATLKDIWNLPTTPSDLRQPHLRCGDRPEDIYRILATGLNGTPMVSFEATLTPDQRWDIIAWILSQRLSGNPAPR
jgi:mono/diheme cytochrome c family protein